MVHEKNWRVSSTRFSLNFCSHSGVSEHNESSRSFSWFSFLFGLGFLVGLVNGSPRSFRSSCELGTDAGSEFIPHKSLRAPIPSSLDTVEDVLVGEVDELEEDVG